MGYNYDKEFLDEPFNIDNLITEARELATENISQPTVFYKDKSQRIMLRLCDALEKAEERGQGCKHCQGWDIRSGAQYCPMCGKRLEVGHE